ncbi:uncharacterized protein CELE_Y92H12BR.3 [Caenorhabditis elegans]|uniref:Isoform b of Uncharacterized protein Y92H12BR.3 n=1 Tax=Caenorhabditis elegans TaxID=6239 RepID=Q9BPN8-2|nr:Uncharacterized protein CELE_Y92H12BR.3 [Caenorhabditis elegans]CCD70785.1 Uncharacterized protein CELE_Y92H12BR.3 [Caenorhabditis elegans]|eukprot:NP_001032991.1 Uncharacterized protein CELE_Y92H12BR.3 [Caenorhabditis elegans]
MKAQLAILSLLVGLLAAQDLRSLLDICANPPKTTPKTLSDKISLPESYKISGSMTDWMKASTSLLVESASKEFRVLEKQTRDQMPEKWIQELTGAKLTSFINVTKTLSDLSQVGLNGLNEAVASSISKNVHPIIPYRVIVFYVESRDSGLEMIVRVAEKTEKKPGNVVGYNYTTELTTAEIFKLMNDSMTLDKMPIEVLKNNGVKEEWMADASTMKMYPPENDDGFIGYTGGAMFVLAIFCLLIGVSIGAVGVFVATRRQRISTLAYQVFE